MATNPFSNPDFGSDLLKEDSSANPFSDPNFDGSPPARGFKGWAQDAAATAVKGAISVPEAIVGLADIPTGGRVGKFLENKDGAFGFRPDEAKAIANDWHSDATKEAQRKFQEADGIWDKTKTAVQNPSLIATTVGESLPSMIAGGAIGRGLLAATKYGAMAANAGRLSASEAAALKAAQISAGAAGEGATMAGSAAEQIRQQTDDRLLSPTQAAAAAGTGVMGGVVSRLSGGLANKLGIGEADTMLTQGARGVVNDVASAKSIPRQVIEGAVTEGLLEELPQSVGEQILQNLALNKNWAEGLDDAVVMGALSGGLMGSGAAGLHGFMAKGGAPALTPEQSPAQHRQPAPGQPLQFGNSPDPLIQFRDGTVARQSEIDAHLASLPESERQTFVAQILGYAPQQADEPQLTTSQGATQFDGVATEQPSASVAAPDFDTSLGAQPEPQGGGLEFQRQIDTSGLSLERLDSPFTKSAPATVLDRQALARQGAYPTSPTPAPVLDTRRLSEQLGLSSNNGGLESAAAYAVDSGATPIAQALNSQPTGVVNGAQAQEAQQAVAGQSQGAGAQERVAAAPKIRAVKLKDGTTAHVNEADLTSGASQLRTFTADGKPRAARLQATHIAPAAPKVVLQNRNRATPASIAQMNAIAGKPDFLRTGASNTMDNGAPIVFGDLPQKVAIGRAQMVADGNGQRVPTQYAVVEAQDLITSNHADGSPVAEYANGVDGKLRAVAGNGRAAGLKAAWQRGTAGQYGQELVQDAPNLGIAPEVLAQFEAPVLVRVMDAADVTPDMGDRSNVQAGLQMSAVEQASNDAQRLNLRDMEFDELGNPTAQTVMRFMHGMPVQERGNMLDSQGRATSQLLDRIRAAAFKQAYMSDSLVELAAQSADPDAKNILNGLAIVAGDMAQLAGAGDFDIRQTVTDAANMAVTAGRTGQSIAQYLQTRQIDENPETVVVMQFMAQNVRSAKRIADGLRAWAELAQSQIAIARQNAEQDTMFGDTPTLSRRELFERLNNDNLTEIEQQQLIEQQRRAELTKQGTQRPSTERAGNADGAIDGAESRGTEPTNAQDAGREQADFALERQTPEQIRAQEEAQAQAARVDNSSMETLIPEAAPRSPVGFDPGHAADTARNDPQNADVRAAWNNDAWVVGGDGYRRRADNDHFGAWYDGGGVTADIGSQYDAHGIAKGDQLGALLNLLRNGINPNRAFHTSELVAQSSVGAGIGANGAYKDGAFILLSPRGGTLTKDGIHTVLVSDLKPQTYEALKREFPGVRFIRYSEAQRVLSQDAGREQADFALAQQTPEQIRAQEEAQAQAARDKAQEDARAAEAERKAVERQEVAQRSEAAANDFQLGQSAEDNLSGQGDIFANAKDNSTLETTPKKVEPVPKTVAEKKEAVSRLRKSLNMAGVLNVSTKVRISTAIEKAINGGLSEEAVDNALRSNDAEAALKSLVDANSQTSQKVDASRAVGVSVTVDNGNKTVRMTVDSVSSWNGGKNSRTYFNLETDLRRTPISKAYEVLAGNTKDEEVEIGGRRFAFEFGIDANSRTKRSSIRDAAEELFQKIVDKTTVGGQNYSENIGTENGLLAVATTNKTQGAVQPEALAKPKSLKEGFERVRAKKAAEKPAKNDATRLGSGATGVADNALSGKDAGAPYQYFEEKTGLIRDVPSMSNRDGTLNDDGKRLAYTEWSAMSEDEQALIHEAIAARKTRSQQADDSVRKEYLRAEKARLEGERIILSSNGNPYKTEGAAAKFIEEKGIEESHYAGKVDGGWAAVRRTPSEMLERENGKKGIEDYTTIQSRVVAEMGLTQAWGEDAITDAQWEKIDNRVDAIQRGQRGLPPVEQATAEAAAAEVGVTLPAEVTRALQADMEGRVVDATTVSDTQADDGADKLSIRDAAAYLKDFTYSLSNLPGVTDAVHIEIMDHFGKSGRDALLMKSHGVSRADAHEINNSLDARKPHKLRAEDMEDAFAIFPGLRAIIDDGIKSVRAREDARQAKQAAARDSAESNTETAAAVNQPSRPDKWRGNLAFSRNTGRQNDGIEGVRDLVVLHNLTEDNLRNAAKIGGLPVPSLGIAKAETPFSGYGNITLIGTRDMIDPQQGVPVYDRDAYTARFPEMHYKKPNRGNANALYERMQSLRELGDDGSRFQSMLFDILINSSSPTPARIAELFDRYNAPRMLYAQEVLGKTIKTPMRDVQASTLIGHDKELVRYWQKHRETFNRLEGEMDGAAFRGTPEYKAFEKEIHAAINRVKSHFAQDDDATYKRISKRFTDSLFPNGHMDIGTRDRLIRDFGTYGKKEIDVGKLNDSVYKTVKRGDAGYTAWVNKQMAGLFDEPTITLRGKQVAPTLDNLVAAMTIGGTVGAEKTMTASAGKTSAMLGKRFKSVAEIQAARAQVVSSSQENDAKKSNDEILAQYRTSALAFFTKKDWRGEVDTWAGLDASMEALANAGKKGGADAAIRQALAAKGFRGVDAAVIDLAKQSIDALRNSPTEYFEAKPQRAVGIGEFRGAVLPRGTDPNVLELLAKHGVQVLEYGKGEGAREKAIATLAKRLDRGSRDVLFSATGDGAANLRTKPKGATTSTIRHAASRAYGKLLDRLEAKGLVHVAQTEEDALQAAAKARAAKTGQSVAQEMNGLRRSMGADEGDNIDAKLSQDGAIEGFFDRQTGKSFLVADGLTEETAPATLMHEVGIHMAADGSMQGVFNRAAMLVKNSKDEFMNRVRDRMEAAGETSAEEAAAYIVTEYEKDRTNAPASIKQFMKDFMAAVRAWLFRNGFTQVVKEGNLTPADISAIARANARSLANGANRADTAQNSRQNLAFSEVGSVDGAALQRQFDETARAYGGQDAYAKAKADGKTKLNYNQWVQVRTPNFKAWFGDWEGDPANASKVVDSETGEPMVVYHGTGVEFTQFDADKTMDGVFWLTSDEQKLKDGEAGAAQSGVVIHAFLQAKKLAGWNEYDRLTTDQLIQQGFDGVQLDDDFIIFNPTQIKSATGNSGAFDSKNPDIRFSRAAPTVGAGVWQAPEATKYDKYTYLLQDKQIDSKRVINAILDTGKQIADALDVYLQETLFHGRAAKRVKDFAEQEERPLIELLRDKGIELSEMEEYLHARHAPEANRVLSERNPNQIMIDEGRKQSADEIKQLQAEVDKSPTDLDLRKKLAEAEAEAAKWRNAKPYQGKEEDRLALSGMSDEEATAVMDSLDDTKRKNLQDAAKLVDGIIAKTRETIVDYGLESDDTVDAWSRSWNHYVPLMREQLDDVVMGGMGTGQGFSIKGKETKGRTGSTKKVVDILANINMQRERAIVRGEKNRVATALLGLVKDNPNKDFWHIAEPGEIPSTQVIDKKTGLVTTQIDPLFKSRDNALIAKVNGVEKVIIFNENDERATRMAVALKNMDAANLEGLLGSVASATRYLAAVNTQYNPIFSIVNMVRDFQEAAINMQATPLAGKQKQVIGNAPKAIWQIGMEIRAQRNGKQTGSEYGSLWEEFQEQGGQTGYRDMFNNSAERSKQLQNLLKPDAWADTKAGRFFTVNGALKVPLEILRKTALRPMLDLLSDYNEAIENGVRLSAYKAALDIGMSKPRAAELAKNLTVNFNRKGQVAQQVGALYAFFNASVQGTARMGQTIFDMEPGKPKTIRLSSLGKKIVGGGVLLGSVQALLLAASGFGDDEPPEFIRKRNLVIPNPLSEKGYISIPMPLGYHVLTNLGRIPTEYALSGFKGGSKRAISLLDVMSDIYNPIGGSGLSMQTLAPSVLDPFAALAENKDFTGRAIAKQSFNKVTPGHALGRDTSTLLAQGMSKAVNYATGGTEYTRGELSPTPDQIDYLIGQVTGGVGREASKVSQSTQAIATGDELPWHKVPLVGRFYGDADSPSAKQSAYYNLMDDVRRHSAEVKGLRNDGKATEAIEYMAENPQATLHIAANAAERQVKKLRDRMDDLKEQNAPRESIKEVETQMTEVMQRFAALVQSKKKP